MQEGIPDVGPDDKVEFPKRGRRSADTGQRWIRSGAWRNGERKIVLIVGGGDGGDGVTAEDFEAGAARESEPSTMDACQPAQSVIVIEDPPFQQIIEIAESPWNETETGDAEQRVEDLRGNFHPDPTRRVDVVAGGPTHCRCGVAEEEEEHTAPGDDVETVYYDEKS